MVSTRARILDIKIERQTLKQPFAIAGHVFREMPAIVATIGDGAHCGRGEAAGVYYLGDDVAHMSAVVEGVRGAIEAGMSREQLQLELPPGGARNALDCAMWELEAARKGTTVRELAGGPANGPLVTTLTLGADTPETMAAGAKALTGAVAIKLKLTGDPKLDIARVAAVRAACPGVWLAVDANQGYTLDGLQTALPAFVRYAVALVEQPLPRGEEARLDGFISPIPLAADESVLSSADLDALVGRFDVINIKLDKCGGLTEALAMARRARELGFKLMVGNMAGSSWAMAPAFIVGQLCDIVDLDGPISLVKDRSPAVQYIDGKVWCDDGVWGRGMRVEQ